MTENQWTEFVKKREDFKKRVKIWNDVLKTESIAALQKELADADGVPEYPLENAVVYNTAFDGVTAENAVKLIVVGDNPGKSEQLNKNRTYLIGQSGKIAEGFFRNHAELGIDFRKDVLILNKTPVHTAKTKELVQFCKRAGKVAADIVAESQKYMAELAFRLQQLFSCEIWIVGYGELKPKGIFAGYRDCLYGLYAGLGVSESDATGNGNVKCYEGGCAAVNAKMCDFEKSVFVYQHFSMNRFSIDLKTQGGDLHAVGTLHRKEIFGY